VSYMGDLAKFLIFIGCSIVVIGVILLVLGKVPLPFGKLPGDITIHKKNVVIFAPITTMIVVSLVLTVLLNLFARWFK